MRSEEKWAYAIGAVVLILLTLGYAALNDWLYGDWRCAFAQCRLEK
jgi:hypothetical protein